ncbi:SET domain-containing protein [Candidatus Woesearchaeota archaeon]|nr:SET domain-containing protein [Candidatus Woesearchaeota archaeon]
MKKYIVKKTKGKGQGLFAAKSVEKGELIYHLDKSRLKRYTLDEINQLVKKGKLTEEQTEHCDYAGNKKYVVDFSPASYMNHSCDPNTIYKMKSILEGDIIALKDIRKGEELTHDYSAAAVDQIDNKKGWVMHCRCGSKNCRKKITGDFFKLSIKLQKKYYPYLPPSIKRKYKERFKKIFE